MAGSLLFFFLILYFTYALPNVSVVVKFIGNI